jgi:hypothetical protein
MEFTAFTRVKVIEKGTKRLEFSNEGMTMTSTRDILEALSLGKINIDEAEKELRTLAFTRVGEIGVIDINSPQKISSELLVPWSIRLVPFFSRE